MINNNNFKKIIYRLYSIIGNLSFVTSIVMLGQLYGFNPKTKIIVILIMLAMFIESTKVYVSEKLNL